MTKYTTQLTKIEEDMLVAVLQGKLSAEIAKECGIREKSVNYRLSQAYNKLGAKTRAEAIGLYWMEYMCPKCKWKKLAEAKE